MPNMHCDWHPPLSSHNLGMHAHGANISSVTARIRARVLSSFLRTLNVLHHGFLKECLCLNFTVRAKHSLLNVAYSYHRNIKFSQYKPLEVYAIGPQVIQQEEVPNLAYNHDYHLALRGGGRGCLGHCLHHPPTLCGITRLSCRHNRRMGLF